MAAYIRPLVDNDDNTLYPITKAEAVYMSDNTTTAETAIAGKVTKIEYKATVGTSWTGSAAPFTQTIVVSGMQATDTPIVDLDGASLDVATLEGVETAYSKIYRITTAANSITVYAKEKTETAIPITLLTLR